jgi:hypothetical protein
MNDGRPTAGGVLSSDPQRTLHTAGHLERLAGWLGVLMVIATLDNGAGFFLRRIGLIDTEAYRRDLLTFCTQPIQQF